MKVSILFLIIFFGLPLLFYIMDRVENIKECIRNSDKKKDILCINHKKFKIRNRKYHRNN
jgi:hypothetical protein